MPELKPQKWLRLDGDDGWQIVVPATDIKPHGNIKDVNEELKRMKVELAGQDCPCKPKIDWESKMIVHNSFQDQERVDAAMKTLSTSQTS